MLRLLRKRVVPHALDRCCASAYTCRGSFLPQTFRDSDVEIQTDGFDTTAYGRMGSVNDKTMGWGGGGLYMTLFT